MARMKRTTSQDVANAAGVSRTTVSFVLNDVPGSQIPEETRRRVWEAARRLGYYPDASARSLASQRSGNIGVLLCRSADRVFGDVFLMEVLIGIHDVLHPRRYHIVLEAVEDVTAPDAYIVLVRSRRVDGLIISGPRTDDGQLVNLEAEGFPVVLLGRLSESSLCQVDVDHKRAARTAVDYLRYRGHRRLAFIGQGPPIYAATQARVAGFIEALSAGGLGYSQAMVQYGDFSRASGYHAMRALLQSDERPTAVFVGSDLVAFGALAAVRDAGLRIPEDVAIVGFDDVPMAADVTPPLTTVHLPAQEPAMRLPNGRSCWTRILWCASRHKVHVAASAKRWRGRRCSPHADHSVRRASEPDVHAGAAAPLPAVLRFAPPSRGPTGQYRHRAC
jgi:DNA-binding LacI/PurR family transcriptional regulator